MDETGTQDEKCSFNSEKSRRNLIFTFNPKSKSWDAKASHIMS